MVDAARQQTELVCWVAQVLQEHEEKIDSLSARISQQPIPTLSAEPDVAKRPTSFKQWGRHYSKGSSISGGGGVERSMSHVSDERNSAPVDDLDEGPDFAQQTAEDRQQGTSLSQNQDQDFLELPVQLQSDQEEAESDSPPGPESQQEEEEATVNEPEESKSAGRVSPQPAGRRSPQRSPQKEAQAGAQQYYALDPAAASKFVTQEQLQNLLAQRLEEMMTEDVERRLDDLAQWTQTELQRLAGPDLQAQMLDVARREVAAAETNLASHLERVQADLESLLEIPAKKTEELAQEFRDAAEALSRRVKPLEDNIGQLRGIRLQVPDLRNDLETLKATVAQMAASVDELHSGDMADSFSPVPASAQQSSVPRHSIPDGSVDAASEEPPFQDSAAHGAHATNAPRFSIRSSEPRQKMGSIMANYMTTQKKDRDDRDDAKVQELDSLTQELKARIEQLEGASDDDRSGNNQQELVNKISGFETFSSIIEDRMKEIEHDFRAGTKRVDAKLDFITGWMDAQRAEELQHNKTWNLANQVDVILSLVKQEFKDVRAELDAKLKDVLLLDSESSQAGGAPGGSKRGSRTGSMESTIAELSEKVKQLQESMHQANLKLAGLKSAHKHAEGQSTLAVDKVKKFQDDIDTLTDQLGKQQVRVDYMLLRASSQDDDRTVKSWKEATSVPGEGRSKQAKTKTALEQATSSVPRSQQRHSLVGFGDRAAIDSLAGADASEIEMNTSRIARLGKKLADLDNDVMSSVKTLRDEFHVVNSTLAMFVEFLPRRQRRLLQRQLVKGDVGDDFEEPAGRLSVGNSAKNKKVIFNEGVETHTFQVEDEQKVPWQLVGEKDVKWSWCFNPMNHMGGRELANCLELFEHERDEFEARVMEMLGDRGAGAASPGPRLAARYPRANAMQSAMQRSSGAASSPESLEVGADTGALDPGDRERFAKIVQSFMPHLSDLEHRHERLVKEVADLKKITDIDHLQKADKNDLQMLFMRITALEKMDVHGLKVRVESVENDMKFATQNVTDISRDLRELGSVAARKDSVIKLEHILDDIHGRHDALRGEVKDAASSSYRANTKFVNDLSELRTNFEKSIYTLQKEKLNAVEHTQIVEKVLKLEMSMRDNRQILSEAGGGQEINAVVKRIILNLEDKIMVLEKKIDALAEARVREASPRGYRDPSPKGEAPNIRRYNLPGVEESRAAEELNGEVASMGEVVDQLKKDIAVSKIHLDEITEQGQQSLELASRLNVLVESAGLQDGEDEGTLLSLNRVQVMVAAAARQLVAGSKWITRETFDSRLGEMRAEYLNETRQVQAKLEDIAIRFTKTTQSTTTLQVVAPGKLPRMLAQQRLPDESQEEVSLGKAAVLERLGSAPGTTRQYTNVDKQPLSARAPARPFTEQGQRPKVSQGRGRFP